MSHDVVPLSAQVSAFASSKSAPRPNALVRIHYLDENGEPGGGTGFLFDSSEGLALATTAHALVGSRRIPVDSETWRTEFKALSEDCTAVVPLPLGKVRTVPRSDDSSLLEDFMVFYASDVPDLINLAMGRTPFDFDNRAPDAGETVTATGFASADGGAGAPRNQATRLIGADPSGYWLAEPPAVPGLSGAPMISAAGLIRGMQTGYVNSTDPRAVLLTSARLRELIRKTS